MVDSSPSGILVIAAHPDDEVLGCGGTLPLHVRNGDRVEVVIACESVSLRYGGPGAMVDMNAQMHAAAKELGVHDVTLLGFEDQNLESIRLTKLITALEDMVDRIQPRVVYCQYGGDVNRDHQLLFKAALVACRPTHPSIEGLFAFYTHSSTEWAYPRSFVPDTWVDIGDTLEQKLAAMACYESELRDYPHPRSLKAIRSKAEATGSECCLAAAEAFMTVRRIGRGGKTPA
jgi:LmbE family N-acetylglucosaminyl deacetylase